MTPTETADILRRYNAWRRPRPDDLPMPDPIEIGEAIDAAVEMIERLEAAEKAVAEAYQRGYATGQEEIEAERDALRAKVAEMEKQEPVASIYIDGKGDREFDDWKCDLPVGRSLLYALPGAQPAPSVPDHKTIRDLLNESGLCAYDREGDLAFMVAATKFAALAAAPKPEAKP